MLLRTVRVPITDTHLWGLLSGFTVNSLNSNLTSYPEKVRIVRFPRFLDLIIWLANETQRSAYPVLITKPYCIRVNS